jgi:Glycoside-hydrolase family GH114
MASKRYRNRILAGAAVMAVATVSVAVGIGTADANTKPAAPTATTSATSAASWAPPTANATFDYQIGGPYTPPAGVTVVSRDHDASAAAGLYNVCYVNAFQAQTEDASWWKTNHPDLLLHDAKGNLVIDKDWNEILLDYSTAAKRAGLTTIAGGWIDQCAGKGFQGVEPDNLDSYTRSTGLLTEAEAVAYATSLSTYAHGKGLAIAQKNDADLSTANAKKAGFDFAVAEECADYDECQNYTATYGNHVIVIEYTQSKFTKACNSYGSTLSIVLRDVDVTTPGSGSYVFKTC